MGFGTNNRIIGKNKNKTDAIKKADLIKKHLYILYMVHGDIDNVFEII